MVKKHMHLDPIKEKVLFWDFSWHEIGIYDLPAKIDHILKTTNHEKLHYVGHSQGCTAFFVMASTKPEYNEKIRFSTMLSPPAYMKNGKTLILRLLSKHSKELHWLAKFVGLHEFLPHTELLPMLGQKLCHDEAPLQELCSNIYFLIVGFKSEQLNKTMLPVLLTNFPAGAASKQFVHYAQSIKFGTFSQFDYGLIKNMIKYKQPKPPKYQLDQITTPIALYYSMDDNLVANKDVEKLAQELPNVVHKNLISHVKFNHLDFLVAKDVVKLLYDDVLEIIQKH